MADIKKNPTHNANLSKNGFDMSMIRKFTSSVGQLLPVYYDFLNPGDKVNFSTEIFSRTKPIKAPAMMQITETVDWYFVPITQIYQFFGEMFYGVSDVKTDLLNSMDVSLIPSTFPSVAMKDIISLLEDERNGASTVSSLVSYDRFGIPEYYNYLRLLDICGFSNKFQDYHTVDQSHQNFAFNPMILAAYQKIYNDVYRLGDYESNNPQSYNLDSYAKGSSSAVSNLPYLLSLRYRPWKKDFFTNVMPSPVFNGTDKSGNPLSNLADINQWLGSKATFAGNPVITDNTVSGSLTTDNTTSVTSRVMYNALQRTVTTANLRSMFAIEKLSEITRRAGKHYDAQTLAHFGFDVPTGISGEVYRLGSDSSVIQVGEVTATAETVVGNDRVPLGDMAGKGTSYSGNKKKEFTAPCHGILMAVYSAVPDADYRSVGVDKLNTLVESEDFYKPEFDRLGMQPLFGYQSMLSSNDDNNGSVLGWQYRYSELKSKYNVCNGEFNSDLRHWAPARNQGFVTVNEQSQTDPLATMQITPNYLDGIMSLDFKPASTDPISPYYRDNLIHMFQFHVFKSSVMSTYGLPNL